MGVFTLMESLLGMGYCLTTENFYTSLGLAIYQVNQKTRQEISTEFQHKILKKAK